ncbi:MAG: holin family protein [Melioribacteraceae bacterium]|nr:holin family protein [Melioribacteraceae bacterium]MCF8414560.1 holin family protein [Melioribacteraceae bacterium]
MGGFLEDIGKGISGIVSGGFSELAGSVKSIIETFTGKEESPEQKVMMAQVQLQIKNAENEMQKSVINAVTEDLSNQRELWKTELANEDFFVRRMRPALGYVGMLIILINYALLPLIYSVVNLFLTTVVNYSAVNLPGEFWIVWGGYMGGYAYLRTKEKNGEELKLNIFAKKAAEAVKH